MCWLSYNPEHWSPIEAEIPIGVLKVLRVRSSFYGRVKLYSPCYPMRYKRNKLYKANFGIIKSENFMEINAGLHSAASIELAQKILSDYHLSTSGIIVQAYIPAGATYYQNEHGEIVSNQLKILL